MEGNDQDSQILDLLGRHSSSINSMGTDIRNVSMDVLVLRAVVYGLMEHAKDAGVDLRPACKAMRDQLPEEYRAAFADRLRMMFGIDLAT
ncbi:MAG: hypothetical protein EPN31_03445 [Castellaniella sp.]|uniref:hypothetical protein n=1 Tax=Castellaniella sp. TaxID=1955812 RepID=UPI00120E117E|nr:hypothetical protein [Castellaniella sp.]TAN30153.1 MAG: hypothetical protein EPN31_03445 [Castellaniella sp.]